MAFNLTADFFAYVKIQFLFCYNFDICFSILVDYILKDEKEKQRLHISAIPKIFKNKYVYFILRVLYSLVSEYQQSKKNFKANRMKLINK